MNSTYNAHEYLTKATELVISIQQTLKDPANNYTNAQRLKIIPQTYELLAIIGLLVGKLETLESELTEYKHQKDRKETVSKLDQEHRDNEMFQRLASDTNTNTNDQEERSPVLLQGLDQERRDNEMFQRLASDTNTNDQEEGSPVLLQGAMTESDGIPEPIGPPERAADKSPQDILDSVDRYFRIPFLRPGATEECRGWRYTHFRGQYVARQMELHPDMTPMLLTAGTDKQICELSLKETGLTRKPWAEILEHEFLSEWTRHGGADI